MPKDGISKGKFTRQNRDRFFNLIANLWEKDVTNKIVAAFLFIYLYIPYFTIKKLITFSFKLLFFPLIVLFKPFKKIRKQCPKCDSYEIKEVKPSSSRAAMPASLALLIGPLGLLYPQAKTLNVCRQCGFSWEDR